MKITNIFRKKSTVQEDLAKIKRDLEYIDFETQMHSIKPIGSNRDLILFLFHVLMVYVCYIDLQEDVIRLDTELNVWWIRLTIFSAWVNIALICKGGWYIYKVIYKNK